MSPTVNDPVKLAAELLAQPSDLGLWLALAEALAGKKKRPLAIRAFAELGAAASSLGTVGLAVACVRRLAELDAKASSQLLATLCKTHCRGSDVLDPGKRTLPPSLPPADDEGAGDSLGSHAIEQAIAAAAEAARKRAPKSLPPTPLVSVLEGGDFRELVQVGKLVRHDTGAVIVDVGQPATALYWIARGAVKVTRGEHELGELRSGAFFGEIALVGGTTRTARVTASEPTWLIELPAAAIEKLAQRAPRLGQVLANHARARLLATVMRTSELFSRLGEDERAALVPLFEIKLYGPGDALVTKGVENGCLFVVASGRCEVRDGDDVLATLAVGDGIGEASLLARKPAAADVVALERTVVLSLARETFDQVAVRHPTLLAEVYKLLVQREHDPRALVHDASDLVI